MNDVSFCGGGPIGSASVMSPPVTVITVYAVKSGEYSDQIVHCVFTTRALAKAYIEALIRFSFDPTEDEPEYYQDRFYILPLQLWDVLPVFDDTATGYWDQRQSDVEEKEE